ncbi:MAG TPA: carbonic anhydrase [Desulfobacterales bacterium]|nr:carbonic anhydrase [Desulfobacterales bacterium]
MKKLVFILLILCLGTAGGVKARMRSVYKLRAGVPPYEIIKKMLVGNNQALKHGIKLYEPGARPDITWLTDPDARIVPSLISSGEGGIYTIRNFGSQLELSAGAVDYGVRHLLTPVLLITVDSGNEAVRLFMEGYGDLPGALRRDLDHLHLALSHVYDKNDKKNKKMSFKERLRKNVEANIDYQTDLAVVRYHDRVRSGRLVVLGTVLDFDNIYKHGSGRLIIININGERSPAKLRKMPMLSTIGREFANLCVGR